jgi:cation diffusion facilitator CzcD-associated flavoprotein CzcO
VKTIETDYLVVGAGAMGMAFTDTLVAETDAHVVVVDRGHAPGGHWTRVLSSQPSKSPAELKLSRFPQAAEHGRYDAEPHQHAARGQGQVEPVVQAALGLADQDVGDPADIAGAEV